MLELTKIVVPKVMAYWKDLAYCMRYSIGDVARLEAGGEDLHDRCVKLFTDWLSTSHGPMPKTYRTLLNYIKEVDNLITVSKKIEEQLIKDKDK